MNDYIVRATAADSSIRAFAITSKNMVEEARKDHDTSPVITAALGRLLSGAAMMGTMMKGEKDLLTIQIQCQGPAQGLTVTADSAGHVKGFPRVPVVELPPNALGKLDVGGALYRKYEEIHYQKAYELETVKRLLEEAGMEFVAAYDAFTHDPVRKDSERIYIIAREHGKTV